MRRLAAAAVLTVLLAFGAYFGIGAWRSDDRDAERPTPAGEPWHIELRPVNDAGPPPCGRPPYRACAENGLIRLTDAASTP